MIARIAQPVRKFIAAGGLEGSWCGRALRGAAPLLAACLAWLVFPAAASTPAPQAGIPGPWPAPPAEPRIAFVRSLASPVDAGVRVSGWNRVANAITGANTGKKKLGKPFGLALDEADNLCLTDTGEGVVCFFDQASRRWQLWEKAGSLAFVSPVAVAKRQNTLYVADSSLRQVVAFNTRGKLLFEIREGLERPSGLALGQDRLWVADAQTHSVSAYAPKDGKFLGRFGKRGTSPGDFNFPTHLAIDGRNQLYVTDSMNYRVQIFDAQGALAGVIGGQGDGSGSFSRPKGVAVDSWGHIYVADALFDNFQIFSQAGQFLLDVGAAGSGPGEFWLPAGMAIGRDNHIYVADSYNQRVQIFKYLGKE